jgi:PAS domain S-box-containing protein
VRLNAAFCRMLGATEAQLVGRPFADVTHPDDRAAGGASADRLAAGEVPSYRLEKRYVRADGSVVWAALTASLLRDADGRPAHLLGMVEDITTASGRKTGCGRKPRSATPCTGSGAPWPPNWTSQGRPDGDGRGDRVTHAQFGAFFYNLTDEQGQSYTLYALSGVPRAAFAGFPYPATRGSSPPRSRAKASSGYADVTRSEDYGRSGPHHGMPAGHLPVRSYLAAPVVSRSGEVLGGLFFGHERAGVFGERDERILVGIAAQAAVAIDNAGCSRRSSARASG